MLDSKEVREAKDALLDLRNEIDEVIKNTESARNWSIADIFAGSSIVGFVKRSKIKDINKDLEVIREKLAIAKKELGDLKLNLDEEISNTNYDFFVDVIFDNIFTDLRVDREIKDVRENLYNLRKRVEEILKKLN
ncbi:hypothetical protein HKO22_08035 [Peptoniphilus sp. AGMB00490]|uniref:Uncharacterized protein n=1 Tax=Peptoniphilus faecalis TaxID=2731255 RepID=A0A848RJN0_9FIRM|nr:hypothetical protein [Peptoniphilus faecalis]NMW85683.1 hypothetical protein [Peptoniphilus faecalis]